MLAEKRVAQNMIVDIRILTVPVEVVVAGKTNVMLREVAFRTEAELVATRLLTIAKTFRQAAMLITTVSLAEVELVATRPTLMRIVIFHHSVLPASSAGQAAAALRVT